MAAVWTHVLLALLLVFGWAEGNQVKQLTACAGETVHLNCPVGQVVYIQQAFWGRDNRVTCPINDRVVGAPPARGAINCKAPEQQIQGKMVDLCGGRQDCKFTTNYTTLTHPCQAQDEVPFLRLTYTCVYGMNHGLVCQSTAEPRLRLACHPGKVIRVYDAFYGRRDSTTCDGDWVANTQTLQNTNCAHTDPLTPVSIMCTGLRTCDIGVDGRLFGDPCPGTSKYLEVDYTCEDTVNSHANDLECVYWSLTGECARNEWMSTIGCNKACFKTNSQPVCENAMGDAQCEEWRQQNQCTANQVWMSIFCRKTCTGCDTKAPCIDRYDQWNTTACTLWADTGECGRNPDFMFRQCTKTCLGCEENSHLKCEMKDTKRNCDTFTINGQCEYNPGYMWHSCFGNCLACDFDPVCENKLPDAECERLKDLEECGKNPTPMLKDCFKTCLGCESPVCSNAHGDDAMCEFWAYNGDCNNDTVQAWMYTNCYKACTFCGPQYDTYPVCMNNPANDDRCDGWAQNNQCNLNPVFMLRNCRRSCTRCDLDYFKMDLIGEESIPGLKNDFTDTHTYVLDPISKSGVLKSISFFAVTDNDFHFHLWRETDGMIGIVYSTYYNVTKKNSAVTLPTVGCFEVIAGRDRMSFTTLRGHVPLAYNLKPSRTSTVSVRIAANEVNFSFLRGHPYRWSLSAEVIEGATCN